MISPVGDGSMLEEDEPAFGTAVASYPGHAQDASVQEDGASTAWPARRPTAVPPQLVARRAQSRVYEPALCRRATSDAGRCGRDLQPSLYVSYHRPMLGRTAAEAAAP
jgi:hypothetical protein